MMVEAMMVEAMVVSVSIVIVARVRASTVRAAVVSWWQLAVRAAVVMVAAGATRALSVDDGGEGR